MKCIQSFGSLDDSFGTSYFVNSSIIIGDSVNLAIDDAVFDDSNGNAIQIDGNSNLQLIDTVFQTEAPLLPNHCNIDCHQIIKNDTTKIRQLHANCHVNTSSLPESEHPESFNFWSPYYLMTADSNNENTTSLYPGESLKLDISITDVYGNVFDANHSLKNATIALSNPDLPLNAFLVFDENGYCSSCKTGISLDVTQSEAGNEYEIAVDARDFVTNAVRVVVTECPLGYGISSSTSQCEQCDTGKYSIESNLQECNVCNEDKWSVSCPGADVVIVDYNYWIQITHPTNSTDFKMITTDCPSSYCCQKADGCDYLLDFDELCAANRNSSTALCGSCIDGYSELLATADCGICDGWHYEYFILPFIMAVLFCLYLLYFDVPSKNKPQEEEVSGRKMILMDDWRAFNAIATKVILYYFQGFSFVLSTCININQELKASLTPLLELFNLYIDFGSGKSDEESLGFCLFDGLTASSEILLSLSVPIFILFILTMAMMLGKCCGCKLNFCCFKNKDVSYIAAYLRGLLIVIGSVLAVIFKIMSCREIGDGQYVHFYYGSDSCFDTLWFLSLIGFGIIIIVWFILDFALFRMKEKRQKRIDNNLYVLIKAYKPECWYWETILLLRRTMLALFTIVSDENSLLNDILTISLCIFFALQIWKQPFRYKRVNRLETLCIFLLIAIVIFVNEGSLTQINDEEGVILGIFLWICVALPMVIVLYECLRVCKHGICKNKLSKRYRSKIELRRPVNSPRGMISDTEEEKEPINKKQISTKL